MARVNPQPWSSQTIKRILVLVTLIGLASVFIWLWRPPQPPEAPTQANTPPTTDGFAFTGAGSCSSSACHGGIAPRPNERVRLNEYSIWVLHDKHAKAYDVLLNEKSKRMARLLKLDKPETSDKCLDCHATNVPTNLQTKSFNITDGVSCESCHGPAGGWLSEHTQKGWKHAQSLSLGMYDTKNTIKRAEKCLSCHLGTDTKKVDHEMIAAGHPDLTFELDTDIAIMPAHWLETEDKGPWFGVRQWAVGQAVALREGMKRLARQAESQAWERGWPELAELDCYACHHSLREPSWRQQRGYRNTPGYPSYNDSRYRVFRHALASISPNMRQTLDEKIEQLHRMFDQPVYRRRDIAATAQQVADIADQLARQLDSMAFDQQITRAILRAVSSDEQVGLVSGIRSAEQAVMTINTLFRTYRKATTVPNEAAITAAIDRLFEDLKDPARFDPNLFAAHLRAVHKFFQ
ncbi:MAG: multiheme c-type cytochrome [Acidobacteriota bacterium]|nr:hypothetical protein [Blastocatellia bacterium]MDW8239578.1 multiheme c-type cytochrome [Acidobacteriota bacterium]